MAFDRATESELLYLMYSNVFNVFSSVLRSIVSKFTLTLRNFDPPITGNFVLVRSLRPLGAAQAGILPPRTRGELGVPPLKTQCVRFLGGGSYPSKLRNSDVRRSPIWHSEIWHPKFLESAVFANLPAADEGPSCPEADVVCVVRECCVLESEIAIAHVFCGMSFLFGVATILSKDRPDAPEQNYSSTLLYGTTIFETDRCVALQKIFCDSKDGKERSVCECVQEQPSSLRLSLQLIVRAETEHPFSTLLYGSSVVEVDWCAESGGCFCAGECCINVVVAE